MFTIQQIKTAHAKVKSGADFPSYIQELSALGILSYEQWVQDGRTLFKGTNGFQVDSDPKYPSKKIEMISNPPQFIRDLKAHQEGKTDYLTFCSDCAKSGIEKWVVDLGAMTCTYYDQDGGKILEEMIPGSK